MLFKKVKSEGKRRVLQFFSVFSNCGFIGFPIVNMVFGLEGVIYASIFNLFFTIFLWTYGVILYSDSKEKKDIKRRGERKKKRRKKKKKEKKREKKRRKKKKKKKKKIK